MKRLLPATLLLTAIAAITLAAAPSPPNSARGILRTQRHAPPQRGSTESSENLGMSKNIEQGWDTPAKINPSMAAPSPSAALGLRPRRRLSHPRPVPHPPRGKAARFPGHRRHRRRSRAGKGSARVIVAVDSREVFRSPCSTAAARLPISTSRWPTPGSPLVTLSDEGNNDSDHLDFGNAQLVFASRPSQSQHHPHRRPGPSRQRRKNHPPAHHARRRQTRRSTARASPPAHPATSSSTASPPPAMHLSPSPPTTSPTASSSTPPPASSPAPSKLPASSPSPPPCTSKTPRARRSARPGHRRRRSPSSPSMPRWAGTRGMPQTGRQRPRMKKSAPPPTATTNSPSPTTAFSTSTSTTAGKSAAPAPQHPRRPRATSSPTPNFPT